MNKQYRNFVLIAVLPAFLFATFMTGCSRDPNVRKQKYFESGKRYFAKDKYREAALQFTNAVRIDSGFADAHYQLALCDLKLGSVQNAYIELSRTVQLQPDNFQAEIDLGNLLLLGRDVERAEDRANYVLSKDANNVNAHVLKAEVSASKHQLDEALAEMNLAVQLDPTRSASYLNLGVLEATKAPQSSAAELDFKKSIELDGKAIQPRLALAAYYDAGKSYAESQQELQEAMKLAPKNQQVWAALVRHYLMQSEQDLAEKTAKDGKQALVSDSNGAQFLARYYLLVNNQKAATAEYRQLAEQFPKERQIQHAYLELLMLQGQTDLALKQVDAILKKFSKDNQALTDRGLLLLMQGKAAEARDVLRPVIKADPQNVVALFALGNSFKVLGDMGQAEAQWRAAARFQPAYLPAQTALADLAVSKRDFGALAQIAKIVQEKAPNAAEGYQMEAEVYAASNDTKSAEEQLQKAISLNPKNAGLYIQLGKLRMALHRDAEAEESFNQALQLDPQQTPAIRGLVQLYLNQKQPQKALNRAQEFAAQFPQNGPAHMLLANLAVLVKNLELAETEFSKATEQMPNNIAAFANLGLVQLKRNETLQAESSYQSAVRNNPKDPEAYWLLATLQDQENKSSEAEKNYRKAIELRPDFGAAANNLAYLMLQNGGNIDQVITYAEIARRQMPNAPEVADTLGWAYYEKGTAGLAVAMLRDAVKAVPNSATYHYHLGMAYSKAGDRQRAKDELQKAIQLEVVSSKKDEIRKNLASLG